MEKRSRRRLRTGCVFLAAGIGVLQAHAQELQPVPAWPVARSPIAIVRTPGFGKPFSVAAEHGAILGEQNGVFEAWAFPHKLLSDFRIEAHISDYPVPIDVNEYAAEIEVDPDHTTITYSHAAFTLKQHMFSPRGETIAGAGALVFFELQSIRPMELTFRFTPEMLRMWPAANFGRPNLEWVKQGRGGYYVLHTTNDQFSGVVAIPGAQPGILPPYQERPKTYAAELKLEFDPKTQSGLFFPLLMGHCATSGCEHLVSELGARVATLYEQTAEYYTRFFDTRLTAETSDPRFDQALRWAEIAIDQAQVRFNKETGLVAGYYSSGDSARPGFGWFFGRDTEWTLYAVNAYGDFALTRTALNFLFARQRADGKIMHEFSQSADQVDWASTPYFYAAADSTPLLVMIMDDYVNTSGDTGFLREHWDAVKKAYQFTREHDSDGDGIYDNSQGTGWVESWPGGMPKQEIYLAALDQQSAQAMSHLAQLMKDDALAKAAAQTAEDIRRKLHDEYFDAKSASYAFSRNADGNLDLTPTIYPAVAWWAGSLTLPDAGQMFQNWASPVFSTDWGTRDVSENSTVYDPISYHQGTVWPLFTGWVSLAEFHGHEPLAGTEHLYQNLNLTWAQDLGACTELLSGAFYQPLGRSSSHQLWSSAMVLSPALRGLLGFSWDAVSQTLRIHPVLPPDWEYARIRNVPLGTEHLNIEMVRDHKVLRVHAVGATPFRLCITGVACEGEQATTQRLAIRMPPVEIGLDHNPPEPGSATGQVHVLAQTPHSVTLLGRGGTTEDLPLRINQIGIPLSGGVVQGNRLHLTFPKGDGWQQVTVRW